MARIGRSSASQFKKHHGAYVRKAAADGCSVDEIVAELVAVGESADFATESVVAMLGRDLAEQFKAEVTTAWNKGVSEAELAKRLTRVAGEPEIALAAARQAYERFAAAEQLAQKTRQQAMNRNLMLSGVGLLIMVVGVAVTVGSYMHAASSPGGGSYVVTHGPIVFGLFQFAYGLNNWWQLRNGRVTPTKPTKPTKQESLFD